MPDATHDGRRGTRGDGEAAVPAYRPAVPEHLGGGGGRHDEVVGCSAHQVGELVQSWRAPSLTGMTSSPSVHAQRRQCVRGLALDRPLADPEGVGDVAHAEVGVVAEHDHGALPRRQGAQRVDHGGAVGGLRTASGGSGSSRPGARCATTGGGTTTRPCWPAPRGRSPPRPPARGPSATTRRSWPGRSARGPRRGGARRGGGTPSGRAPARRPRRARRTPRPTVPPRRTSSCGRILCPSKMPRERDLVVVRTPRRSRPRR